MTEQITIKDLLQKIVDIKAYKFKPEYPDLKFFLDDDNLTFEADDHKWQDIRAFKNTETLIGFSASRSQKNGEAVTEFDVTKLDVLSSLNLGVKTQEVIQEIKDFLVEQSNTDIKKGLIKECLDVVQIIMGRDTIVEVGSLTKKVLYYFKEPLLTGEVVRNHFDKLNVMIQGITSDKLLIVNAGRGEWVAPDYSLQLIDLKLSLKTLELLKVKLKDAIKLGRS